MADGYEAVYRSMLGEAGSGDETRDPDADGQRMDTPPGRSLGGCNVPHGRRSPDRQVGPVGWSVPPATPGGPDH